MRLITNKSKNLLYRISSDSNTTIQFSTSYAVVTQTVADTDSSLYFKLQGYKNNTQGYTNIFSGEVISSTGVFTKTFTTPSTTGFDLIRFGLNGSKVDTLFNCKIDLKPSTTYTFTCNFTNITQGSVSWKDMMLVEGSTEGEYEPYSYNLLNKWYYPATETVNGVTFTNNGDGSITVNSLNITRANAHYQLSPYSYITAKKGHKYCALSGTNRNGGYFYVDVLNESDTWISAIVDGMYTVPNDNYSLRPTIFAELDKPFDDKIYTPQLYDLTLMYGAGKEPTTVNQFYADHPELKVSPLGFIELKNLEINNKNIKRLRYKTADGYLDLGIIPSNSGIH